MLQYLHNRPEQERLVIAQVLAGVVVLVLLGAWFAWGGYQAGTRTTASKEQRQQAAASLQAVRALWRDASDSFSALSKQLSDVPVGAGALDLRRIDPQSPDAEALIRQAAENYVRIYVDEDETVRFDQPEAASQ